MLLKKLAATVAVALTLAGVTGAVLAQAPAKVKLKTPPGAAPAITASAPADPAATPETRRLLANLYKLMERGILFGHQDDLAYGLDPNGKRWMGEVNRSDVRSVTGSYPAVYGWDLGHLELDSARNLDGVPFARLREYVQQAYARGGINTISWHLANPQTGKSSWDTTGRAGAVAYSLPGGKAHAAYLVYLDRVAAFLGSLKGSKGEAIPVIFRPFHEHTGNWFWWGESNSAAADYQALWRFTIDYLRNTKKLHNLLIAYSAADTKTKAHYLERYPGDAYVDVVGFDVYYFDDGKSFQERMARELPILQAVAREHHKLPTLAETGYERLPAADWWTKTLLPAIAGYQLSYLLVWRNGRPDHYYAPYPGQVSAADFQKFYQSKNVLFEQRLTPLRIYTKKL